MTSKEQAEKKIRETYSKHVNNIRKEFFELIEEILKIYQEFSKENNIDYSPLEVAYVAHNIILNVIYDLLTLYRKLYGSFVSSLKEDEFSKNF